MEIVDLVKECLPYVFSILATIVAFIKGKPKKTKSVEEIKATADKKYHAYVEKQLKKNKIENVLIETTDEEVEV
ncbi:MAG: hypothetical protein E7374_02880 [Clostridiales bacterium]|nr:hypothetical protein [Clostridiales bacterium]